MRYVIPFVFTMSVLAFFAAFLIRDFGGSKATSNAALFVSMALVIIGMMLRCLG